MSSNKRKVAPSSKPKGQRSATSNSESESSVPSRYYSTTTAASSSVALSDTDYENNITITGHPTQSIFDWTASEQSTTVDLSYSDPEAPSDKRAEKNTANDEYTDSEDSNEELRKPWWKRKRVMLGVAFAAAGILVIILATSLGWAYLSPKKSNDEEPSTEGFFVGPYESRSINERVADKHANRGRLHRARGRANQDYRPNVRPRDQDLPNKNKNPYRKPGARKQKDKTKAYSSNGKGKQTGRFLGSDTVEQGQFNENLKKYEEMDELKRRKHLKYKNKAHNTDIRNFTNPVETDSTESVEIPESRSPAGQPVEKEMISRNGFKFPFHWPLDTKFFECPPNGCPTNYDIFHKNGLRNKKTGPYISGVPFKYDFKPFNSTIQDLLYKIQENIRNRVG